MRHKIMIFYIAQASLMYNLPICHLTIQDLVPLNNGSDVFDLTHVTSMRNERVQIDILKSVVYDCQTTVLLLMDGCQWLVNGEFG